MPPSSFCTIDLFAKPTKSTNEATPQCLYLLIPVEGGFITRRWSQDPCCVSMWPLSHLRVFKSAPPSPPRLFVCLRAGNTFFIILFSELRTAPITEYTFHNLKISKYLMTEYLRKGLGWDTEVKRVDWRPAERVTSICLYLTQVTHIHISSLFFSVCLCLCRL